MYGQGGVLEKKCWGFKTQYCFRWGIEKILKITLEQKSKTYNCISVFPLMGSKIFLFLSRLGQYFLCSSMFSHQLSPWPLVMTAPSI